jgi:hypothetical protein
MPAERVTITVRGDSRVLDFSSLGARDGSVVRRHTQEAGIGRRSLMGIVMELNSDVIVDLDTYAVAFWLAGRKAGLADVVDAFPTYGDDLSDPEVFRLDLHTDDGEELDEDAAAERALAETGDDADPLPSAAG